MTASYPSPSADAVDDEIWHDHAPGAQSLIREEQEGQARYSQAHCTHKHHDRLAKGVGHPGSRHRHGGASEDNDGRQQSDVGPPQIVRYYCAKHIKGHEAGSKTKRNLPIHTTR